MSPLFCAEFDAGFPHREHFFRAAVEMIMIGQPCAKLRWHGVFRDVLFSLAHMIPRLVKPFREKKRWRSKRIFNA
jgi:hypothetical protein